MCGRFVSASPPEEIAEYFGAVAVGDPLESRYNVAPTLDVYVVYEQPGAEPSAARRLDQFYWGLVPGFAKDMKIGARMINARSETAATNNSFRGSLARRRCIVPADGFYEWQKFEGSKAKQPFYIHRADGHQLAMAGLWAEWRGVVAGEAVAVRSTTILCVLIAEDPDRDDLRWKPAGDVACRTDGDLAGGRSEHEADGVGTEGDRHQRVLLVGDATDLHPHDAQPTCGEFPLRGASTATRGTRRSATAAAGSPEVTRCSPTRTAS